MVKSADYEEACETAEHARNYHCADDDLFDIDSYVASCLEAFADNRYLISVLAVAEIDIHSYCQRNGNEYDKQIFVSDRGQVSERKYAERA